MNLYLVKPTNGVYLTNKDNDWVNSSDSETIIPAIAIPGMDVVYSMDFAGGINILNNGDYKLIKDFGNIFETESLESEKENETNDNFIKLSQAMKSVNIEFK